MSDLDIAQDRKNLDRIARVTASGHHKPDGEFVIIHAEWLRKVLDELLEYRASSGPTE